MIAILANATYRHLFAAQVLSLAGTGLTTVALGLLAHDLAGGDAGVVLGTALAIKMVAYVGIAPLAGALAGKVPRRSFLVALDGVRAAMVLLLPFVTEVWQIYVLVFAFQACSAAFTPTFQATIPDVLTDEADYTRALSLSRLAYDLESLLSPLLAAALLVVVSFHWLFAGTAAGFLASALLVASAVLPAAREEEARPFLRRATRGAWIYLATPRLRGLLALSFAVSAGGAMVIVNTVVLVKESFGGADADVALAFAAYGLGSMAVALALPALVAPQRGEARLAARTVMIAGGGAIALVLPVAALAGTVAAILPLWTLLGAGAALVQTPAGLVLRRSCREEDRPALFAAQFALSHACWLVTYPAAGLLGAWLGLGTAFVVMALAAGVGAALAAVLWPRHDPQVIAHEHPALEHSHVHQDPLHHGPGEVEPVAGTRHRHRPIRHAHAFVIDDHHPAWPAG